MKVKRYALTMISLLGICMVLGCSDSYELSLNRELCPTNIDDLVSLSAEELECVDFGRMNLICADAAFGAGQSDMPRLLRKLDEWAEVAKIAEQRYRPSFDRNPARYDNSYAKFRAVNLILTIKEDFVFACGC